MSHSQCKTCNAAIIWFKTADRRNMPVDYTVQADQDKRAGMKFDPERHVSHFSTCPDANKHRTPRTIRPHASGGQIRPHDPSLTVVPIPIFCSHCNKFVARIENISDGLFPTPESLIFCSPKCRGDYHAPTD